MNMPAEQLKAVIAVHAEYLATGDESMRAYLSEADLHEADLSGADLSEADLRRADLHGADLHGANLSEANLSEANLSEANLYGANLRRADLHGTIGNMREVRSLHIDTWPVTWTSTDLQIGCQRHSIADWWTFDNSAIAAMEPRALEWWRKWKPILKQTIEE